MNAPIPNSTLRTTNSQNRMLSVSFFPTMSCITSIGLAGIPLATGTTFSVGAGVGGGSGVRTDSATRRHVFGSFALLSAIPMWYVPTDAFSLAWIVI